MGAAGLIQSHLTHWVFPQTHPVLLQQIVFGEQASSCITIIMQHNYFVHNRLRAKKSSSLESNWIFLYSLYVHNNSKMSHHCLNRRQTSTFPILGKKKMEINEESKWIEKTHAHTKRMQSQKASSDYECYFLTHGEGKVWFKYLMRDKRLFSKTKRPLLFIAWWM